MATKPPTFADFLPAGVNKNILDGIKSFPAVGTPRRERTFRLNSEVPGTIENLLVKAFGSAEGYFDASNKVALGYKETLVDNAQKAYENYSANPSVSQETIETSKEAIQKAETEAYSYAAKLGVVRPTSTHKHQQTGQTISLDFVLNNERFTFIPQNIAEKGWVKDGKQYYFDFLLDKDNFDSLRNDGSFVDLSKIGNYEIGNFDTIAKKNNISTQGFLVPFNSKIAEQARNPTKESIYSYDPNSFKGDYKVGEIQGITLVNGNPTYVAQGIGPNATQARIQAANTLDYTGQNTTDESRFYVDWYKEGGSRLGAFGDFINDVVGSDLFKIGALALGGYGLYNLATAPAAAGAGAAGAGAAGAGASLAPGSFQAALPGLGIETAATAAGATAVPGSFAAALPGLVAPVGVLDLPSFGLLDTATFPQDGIKATASTTGGASAPFATTPAYSKLTTVVPAGGGAATVPGLSVPGLSSMGGGTGLQVPVAGGIVTEMGFVPVGATPSLGDPASFINNPDYLGSPVISEDYLALTGADMPGGFSLKDALDYARQGSQLLGGQQQQQQQFGLFGGGQVASGARQTGGVDYSGLLGLLQGKARVPGVAPLLAPVVNPVANPYQALLDQQSQYQSLLG